jgi:hypothetical protein
MKYIYINSKKIVAYILLAFLLVSCNDYLEIPPESVLIKEKYWLKKDDVYTALGGVYSSFRGTALESLIWGEVRADNILFPSLSNFDFFGDKYYSIQRNDIRVTNSKISWSNYYSTINLANTLMYYSTDVLAKDNSFTPRMKDAVDAEALFIRSMCYFYLVRVWKEVPLVTQPSLADTSNLYYPKRSEADVMKQIIKDLLIAKDKAYTTEYQDNPRYYKGRANKYSIMALLADVYLWNQQYQKCIDYCDSLENTGLFSLVPGTEWGSLYNPGNSKTESLFEIQYNSSLVNKQDNPVYENLVTRVGYVLSMFSDEDLNRSVYSRWKYQLIDLLSLSIRTTSQRDANFIYYRYAEIFLMKAEAYTELGPAYYEKANDYYSRTITRAGLATPEPITDLVALRAAILLERQREFYYEGKRWFDLLRAAKRNNFFDKQIIIDVMLANVDATQQEILKARLNDTMSYYLPIPENDIVFNRKLLQNPFYDR